MPWLQAGSPFQLSAPTEPEATGNPIDEVTAQTAEPQTLAQQLKAQAVTSQERIETKLTSTYLSGYEKYLDQLLSFTEFALRNGKDVSEYLNSREETLVRTYMKEVEKTLEQALDRGFSFAASQSKAMSAAAMLNRTRKKRVRFNDVDQQAIDALKREQQDGKKETLVKRAIESFLGFNATRSKEIVDLIAEKLEQDGGTTLENIAASIREAYGERYKNQAFTIARTELLSAISEGIKWNHDILGEVFTDVQKQWFHVGDVGSNPDARDWHQAFEFEGPKPKDYKWGGVLAYPRDPSAGANEVINCRCSMVSVVPDGATSNAEVILDRL